MPPTGRSSSQDSCPGALAVHRAEDGNLVRIRIPGGILRATQLRALADAAVRLGDGHLELTSRGNVQLRALEPGAEIDLAAVLSEIDLLPSESHERVRNIAASPLTGRDGSGACDVRPVIAELDGGLCADPDLAELSGRFLFAVDDGRRDVSGLDSDVALVAVAPDTVALLLTGHDTGLRTRLGYAARLALAVTRAFLAARDPRSPAWRMAELDPAVRAGCARSALAGTPEGLVWRDGTAVSPRGGQAPAVGVLPQRDGLTALCVAAALGRLDAAQADVLCRASADGSGEIVVTPWRTVLVPDLAASNATTWLAVFGAAGLLTDPASPLVRVSACAGQPRCGRALADVRTDALRAHAAAAPESLAVSGSLAVHWIGCERACGRPAGRHVQVLAEVGGYEISLDGEARAHVPSGGDLAAAVTAARADAGTGAGGPMNDATQRTGEGGRSGL